MTVLFDGVFYQAVDIGREGGRYAVSRKGIGTVLMTTISARVDEKELAIEAARAMDAAMVAQQRAEARAALPWYRRWLSW